MKIEVIYTFHDLHREQEIEEVYCNDTITQEEFMAQRDLDGVAKISLCQIGEKELLPWIAKTNGKFYFDKPTVQ